MKKLEQHASVIRGLINYHKRMALAFGSGCKVNTETKSVKRCFDCEMRLENGQCPSAAFANDVYLGALEEALRLIEKEINRIGGSG